MRKNTGKNTGIKNLRPAWKKGVCPNPSGRPKDPPIIKDFKKACKAYANSGELFDLFKAMAKDQNVKAAETLAHYGVGKPPEKHEIAGKDGGAIAMRIIIDD